MINASLHGRLGGDPVARETKAGNTMATASLAVNAARYDEDDATVWFSLAAFGRTADELMRHAKGDVLSAMGTLYRSRFTTRSGEARETWSLTCEALVSAKTVRPRGGRKPNGTTQRQQASDQRPFDDAPGF
ncbi:MAG: single-stranded DNA-binding protein [Rhodospirillales bacterium]|nr:single-stranded DNA-binding protein [Rhodospirillales bacterium]